MNTIRGIKNKDFDVNRKPRNEYAQSVSKPTRSNQRKMKWVTRRICLFHGERFHWKQRCRRCRRLITFQIPTSSLGSRA
jgi:hypothetical protein